MAKDEWRSRLYDAIRNDGRALTAISQAAGLGVNYVEQLMKEDKAITVPVLLRLCEVLNINAGYLFTGVRLDADLERLLGYAAEASPAKIQSLVAILKD